MCQLGVELMCQYRPVERLRRALGKYALFGVTLFLITSGTARASDWDFIIAPYILAPFIDGSASAGRIEAAGVNVDPVDIVEALNIGAMLHTEVQHVSGLGIALDYAFMDLGDSASLAGGAGAADIDIFQGIFEAYGTYRVMQSPQTLDLYAGIRWWDIDVDLTVSGGPINANLGTGDSWVDPVLGARGAFPIANSNWRLMLQGDIGGFGVGSDFSWNVQGGAAWDASDTFSLILQYRALGVDRETGTSGTPNRFVYDTVTHGPIVGFLFRI